MDRWDGMDFTVYAALIAKSWYLVDTITCTAYRKYGFMISIYFLLMHTSEKWKKKKIVYTKCKTQAALMCL